MGSECLDVNRLKLSPMTFTLPTIKALAFSANLRSEMFIFIVCFTVAKKDEPEHKFKIAVPSSFTLNTLVQATLSCLLLYPI